MKSIPRIAPKEARLKVENGQALLVCAEEPPELFEANQLEGAISLQEFRSFGAELPWDREIIFYCASPNDQVAAAQAAAAHALGLLNAKVLEGGADGWRSEGYPVAA